MKSPGCDHCSHPLFAGVRCDICGWTCEPDDDSELRARVEDSQDAATFFANLQHADEALMRQALEALQAVVLYQAPEQYVEREVALRKARASITALRERLEETK